MDTSFLNPLSKHMLTDRYVTVSQPPTGMDTGCFLLTLLSGAQALTDTYRTVSQRCAGLPRSLLIPPNHVDRSFVLWLLIPAHVM
jgi:hypothetical protein